MLFQLIFTLLISTVVGVSDGEEVYPNNQTYNATWGYGSNGQDWDLGQCQDLLMQSPAPIYTYKDESVSADPTDWGYMYTMLPGFFPADFKAADSNVTNYVYTAYPPSDMGGFYATEPLADSAAHVVYWKINNMKLHAPAEHTLNGEQYDAEFQIEVWDEFASSMVCTGGKALMSLLIKVDDSEPDEFFSSWVGKDEFSMDLSTILPKYMAYTKNIVGYRGSSTQPPCYYRCWYILTETFYMSSQTLQTLTDYVTAAVPAEYANPTNNRILNTEQGVPPSLTVVAHGKNAPDLPVPPTKNVEQTDL